MWFILEDEVHGIDSEVHRVYKLPMFQIVKVWFQCQRNFYSKSSSWMRRSTNRKW